MRVAILEERAAALRPLVESLSIRDRAALANLTGKLLQAVGRDDTHKLRICRLCDGEVCVECPIHVDVGHGTSLPEKETR